MLMRSEGNDAVVDCEDPMTVIACTTDTDACPAKCREAASDETDGVVKAGDLAVKSSAAEDRKVVVQAWDPEADWAVSDLDTLTFRTSEEVTLTKVVLEKYGYADASLVKSVWLEDEDGTVISNKANVTTKGLATLSLKKDYKKVDGTLNATIVVETVNGSTVGWTIGFKVKDVTSTAANVDLGNYKAYQYDVVAYNGTVATVTARAWEKSYNYEAWESYEVAKFKVKAPEDSSIVVRGFTLTNEWELTASEEGASAPERLDISKFLDKVSVKVDGKDAKATYKINKKELTISLSSDVELAARQTLEVVVYASLDEDFDEYGTAIHFAMASAWLSASDKNDARITVDVDGAAFMSYIFKWGKVKFTSTKLGNVDAALGSVDVKIAEWNVTVAEPVEWSVSFAVKWVTSGNANSADAIDTIRLFVGEDEFEGNVANGVATFEDVEISESGKVRILVDLKEGVEYENLYITFGSLEWDLEYTDGEGDAETSGPIYVSRLNLTAAKWSLTNSLTSKNDAEFKNGELNTIVVFDGTYTAKKQDVELQEWSIEGDALELNNKTKVRFLVTVGNADGEDDYVNGAAEGDLSEDVLVKVGESVKVKVEAEIDANEVEICPTEADAEAPCEFPKELGRFTLTLNGVDMNDNPAGEASRKTVALSIVKIGSVVIETPSTAKTVLRKAADQPLASVTVKPEGNSEATIESVVINYEMEALEDLSDWDDMDPDEIFTLYVDWDPVEFEMGDGTITAEWLSVNIKSEWAEVKLELNEEWAIDFLVTSITVNTETSAKQFRKMFVPALVKISAQKDLNGLKTVFTYSVEKKSSDHVYNVEIKLDEAGWRDVNGKEEVTNWITDEVLNENASYYVTAIKYCLNEQTCECEETDAEEGCYVITKDEFNDFFRIGETYATVNKSTNNS